ncbi:hypothetical protein SAMN02982919_02250 [Giesbergeria anulus]|uniref:Uncharacterized protein n=1 Tax=Giesbergeria anulus TaxID=180197 RepID=A0A1H9NKD0_9BURK|nr:hypothetical protein SAMN02982919_02250 [Giesbergeria anulus]
MVKNGFVLAVKRGNGWFFKSFHERKEFAENALHRTIDTDALRVFPALVRFSFNGMVQKWIEAANPS